MKQEQYFEKTRHKRKMIETAVTIGSFILATMILAMCFVTSSYAEITGAESGIKAGSNYPEILCSYDKTYKDLIDLKDDTVVNKNIYIKIKTDSSDDVVIDKDRSKVEIKKNKEDYSDITNKILDADYLIEDEGEYTLSVELVDSDNNIYNKKVFFTADKTAPEIKLIGQTEDNYAKSLSQLSAVSSDTDVSSMAISASCGEKKMSGESKTNSVTFGTKEESYDTDGETWTVSVSATDKAGNKSEKSFKITKDNVAPNVSIDGANDGEYYNKDLALTLNASDTSLKSSDIKTSLNGKEVEDNKDLTEEGSYIVIGTATDKAGNEAKTTIKFVIDKTAPSITFSGAEDSENYQNPKDVIAKLSENGDVYLSATCDGKSVTIDNVKSENENIFSSFSDDGEYVITAYGIDKAGNQSDNYTITVTKDSVAPIIALSGIENGKYYNKNQTLNISVEERNYNTNKVTVDIEKTYKGKTEKVPFVFTSDKEISSNTYTASEEGYYAIKVTSIDKAGNTANKKTISFTIDKTPPKTSFSGVDGGKHYRTNPTLTISPNEDSTVYYTIACDNKKVSSKNGKNEQSIKTWSKDGDYVITAYSVDLAGNKGPSVTKKFTKDSTAPKMSISGASHGKYYNKAISLKLNTKERYYSTTKVTVEGYRQLGTKKISLNRTYKLKKSSDIKTLSLQDTGTYHFSVYATDEAGNKSATKKISFTIDTKKPVITISIPKKVNGYSDSVTPKVTIKDDYMGTKTVSLKKTMGNNTGIVSMARSEKYGNTGGTTSYKDFAKLKDNDGVYVLSVTTKDKAGNTATKSETFTVDRFGSIFKVLKKPSEKYNQEISDDIVIKEINVGKIKSYKAEIYKDDEKIKGNVSYVTKNSYTREYTIDASNFDDDAVYRVNLVTKDNAGNTSQSQKQDKCNIWFTVDNTSPVINYSGIDENEIYKSEVKKFTVSMTDTIKAGTLEVYVNGAKTGLDPVGNSENEYEVTLQSGYNQNVRIVATDAAGNKEEKEIQNITVSDSPFAVLIAHKGITIGASATGIAVLVGIILLLKRRKRNQKRLSPGGDNSGMDDDLVF